MGIKKYEIITVDGLKRIRALRSFRVQDRYVNIGDVGGVVYDEKTLSQDGNAWIFKGRFDYPGARISGDSIVDVGEIDNAVAKPSVRMDGASKVVSFGPLQFQASGAVNLELAADDFEQGSMAFAIGQPVKKLDSPDYIRLKDPIYLGGKSLEINAGVSGYTVYLRMYDADGLGISTKAQDSGEGVKIDTGSAQYAYIVLTKKPVTAIVPADADTAALTVNNVPYEGSILIRDSVLSVVNPSGGTYNTFIYTGAYNGASATIEGSEININRPGTNIRNVYLLANITNSRATVDVAQSTDVFGNYTYCENLKFSGVLLQSKNELSANSISGSDCKNLEITAANIPGLADIVLSGNPLKFLRCNMSIAAIYNHPAVKNVYSDIDFNLAANDLDEVVGDCALVSSEVNGMYRLYDKASKTFGALIECLESVHEFTCANVAGSYNTIIYKDAYINGSFDFAGTNVLGGSSEHHPREAVFNVKPRAVQGGFTLTAGQKPAPNNSPNVVRVDNPLRINGHNGLTVYTPTGIQVRRIFVDVNGNYVTASGWASGVSHVAEANITNVALLLTFQKSDGSAITPEELDGVTVTVYNGCKIVNTGDTALDIKGNTRINGNATLVNSSITGSAYVGGNAIVSNAQSNGYLYMRGNTVLQSTPARKLNYVHMEDNAKLVYNGTQPVYGVYMSDDAYANITAVRAAIGQLRMKDKARIDGPVSVYGFLQMDGLADTNGLELVANGNIRLTGRYKQTAAREWTGNREISSENDPQYDNNANTQYDF